MKDRFSGQVAVVTGGARGLGKAIAGRISKEGGAIAIFDLHEDAMEQTATELAASGATVSRHQVDVANETSVQEGFQEAVNDHGRVDIVVNCAGIVGPTGLKASEVDVVDFEQVLRVNTVGSFIISKHSLRLMSDRNYGRILLVASIAGKEGNAGMTAYSASKAAVIGLVKSVGKEYAETGITVNGLAPAVVRTDMVEGMPPEQVKYMTDKIPMGRLGRLDEVAALSAWIVSREASFNTGFVFDLTGGRATY